MKIDFHLHTNASFDCESDPLEVVEWAVKKGLDGLFITDHDTTLGFDKLKEAASEYNLLVLPGVEFTASRGTHYLIYLTPEMPLPKDDLSLIKEVHRRGGLVGIPHPFRSGTGLVYNQFARNAYSQSEVDDILSHADMIEVFNAKSCEKENAQAQTLLHKYPNLKGIAGSDSHKPSTVGGAHTEIDGFQYGSIDEMKRQLKSLPSKIVILPEVYEAGATKTMLLAAEGFRRLTVRIKPAVPKSVWSVGKGIYRRVVGRMADKRAAKSIVKQSLKQ